MRRLTRWCARSSAVMLAVAILAAPPARATITVEGDAAFKMKVKDALDAIKAASAALKTKIEGLEGSANDHKIKETKVAKGSSNLAENGKNAENGKGTGSTTEWETAGTQKYDEDVDRDPTAALLHELCHACDCDKGTQGRGNVKGPDGEIDKDEVEACKCENMYRTAKSLLDRRKYGGKLLPGATAHTTTTTSTTTTTTTTTETTTTSTTTTSTTMPGATCGDDVLGPGEQCDQGTGVCVSPGPHQGMECSTRPGAVACQSEGGACLDGQGPDTGQPCNNPAACNSDVVPDACRSDCGPPRCGDFVVDSFEQCDDGNTQGGDGCSPSCQPE